MSPSATVREELAGGDWRTQQRGKPLTPGEWDIMGRLALDPLRKAVAYDIGISEQALKNRMQTIYGKLGIIRGSSGTRQGSLIVAFRLLGMLSLPTEAEVGMSALEHRAEVVRESMTAIRDEADSVLEALSASGKEIT